MAQKRTCRSWTWAAIVQQVEGFREVGLHGHTIAGGRDDRVQLAGACHNNGDLSVDDSGEVKSLLAPCASAATKSKEEEKHLKEAEVDVGQKNLKTVARAMLPICGPLPAPSDENVPPYGFEVVTINTPRRSPTGLG